MSIALQNKFIAGRGNCVLSSPFFGSLLFQQRAIFTDKVETMSTTGKKLYVNLAFVDSLTDQELIFVLAHEAMHPALEHHARIAELIEKHGDTPEVRDTANKAADYVINPILLDSNVGQMPSGALYDLQYAGHTMEHVFYKLWDQQQQESQHSEAQDDNYQHANEPGAGDGGDAAPDQGEKPDNDGHPSDSGDGQPNGMDVANKETPTPADPDSPSDSQGASGPSVPDCVTGNDYGSCGEVCPPEPGTDIDDARAEARQAILQAGRFAEAQAQAGTVDGALGELIKATRSARAPWRELLRRFMTDKTSEDYTWSRPNRNYIASGMYLPSRHSEALPPIAYVIDASGSMPRRALEDATAELQALVEELQPAYVDVLIHTSSVDKALRFERGEPIELGEMPSGGTRFAPVCDLLDGNDETYACTVWLTDLEACDWHNAFEPESPVLFLDYTSRNERLARWGDVVAMEDL